MMLHILKKNFYPPRLVFFYRQTVACRIPDDVKQPKILPIEDRSRAKARVPAAKLTGRRFRRNFSCMLGMSIFYRVQIPPSLAMISNDGAMK